jgi:DNA-binding NtrC family response regulator
MSREPAHDRDGGQTYPSLLLVCDDARVTSGVVSACAVSGIALRVIDRAEFGPPHHDSALPCVGLVRVCASGRADPGLETIRELAPAGVHVIAFGDGADEWAIGERCRPLLAGAVDVLDMSRPGFLENLRDRVEQYCAAEARRRREQDDVRATFHALGIVGESEAMIGIFRWIARISRLSDLHTLITGETGTGKQLVAEATHRLDPKRHDGPFVSLNCAAVSPHVAESELFGHRRGAFTGAERDRKGLIRAAHGGVLFLDEIGELDLGLQAKLLRVVQEGRVLSVGDDHEIEVDVRMVAATNRDLAGMVRDRTFRADLFHRLNVLSIELPPLRERRADVAALVRHFLARDAHLGAHGPLEAGRDFIAALAESELPGNARQVENIVRRAIARKEDASPLGLRDLPPEIWAQVSNLRAGSPVAPPVLVSLAADSADAPQRADVAYLTEVLADNAWSLSRSLACCERSLVEVALHASHGNQSETARLLGITPRCVYNKLRKHRLTRTSA